MQLLVRNLQFEDGKMIAASQYFSAGEASAVELTAEELRVAETIKVSSGAHRKGSIFVTGTIVLRGGEGTWVPASV